MLKDGFLMTAWPGLRTADRHTRLPPTLGQSDLFSVADLEMTSPMPRLSSVLRKACEKLAASPPWTHFGQFLPRCSLLGMNPRGDDIQRLDPRFRRKHCSKKVICCLPRRSGRLGVTSTFTWALLLWRNHLSSECLLPSNYVVMMI